VMNLDAWATPTLRSFLSADGMDMPAAEYDRDGKLYCFARIRDFLAIRALEIMAAEAVYL